MQDVFGKRFFSDLELTNRLLVWDINLPHNLKYAMLEDHGDGKRFCMAPDIPDHLHWKAFCVQTRTKQMCITNEGNILNLSIY